MTCPVYVRQHPFLCRVTVRSSSISMMLLRDTFLAKVSVQNFSLCQSWRTLEWDRNSGRCFCPFYNNDDDAWWWCRGGGGGTYSPSGAFQDQCKIKNTETNITWLKSQTCSPFTNVAEELNWKLPRTTPASERDLNPRSPFKSSALTTRPRCLDVYVMLSK